MMRQCLFAVLIFAAAFPVAAAPPGTGTVLRTYPQQIYFTTSNARENLSGSIFFLILEEPTGETSSPQHLELNYRRAGAIVRTERMSPPFLEAVDLPSIPTTRIHSASDAKLVQWPHAYRLFLTVPGKLQADSIDVRLVVQRTGRMQTVQTTLPVRTYDQKTLLKFPFKGEGMVSVGGVMASGHRNRSGLYAVDALGLTATYGPMQRAEPDDDPKNYAGWGREIIAPAAGRIVVVRKDRPDQPIAGNADPAFLLPEYRNGGDPGNFVVIDHGNSEFSMIAHLQSGSVRVNVGDQVVQSQVIGLMGNSGDTTGPHVHYQLQNGADWERSDGLPIVSPMSNR